MDRRHFLVGGLAAGCAARLPAAPVATPRQWFDRWLAAFNAADLRVYAAFVREHVPGLLPYLDDDLALRETTGGFNLLALDAGEAGAMTALVRDRRWDRRSRVTLVAGATAIDDLSFLPAPAGDPGVARLGEAAAVAAIAAKLTAEAAEGRFSGVVRIDRGGRPLLRAAYGLADAAAGRRATADTRFCIGSMGKMFTAVAVLQLISRGRLALTDPIARWIPDYPNVALARAVSVEQLLTHSGGTGDIFGPAYDANAARLVTPDDFIGLYGARETLFVPGARYGYSNYGYVLLGALIERASGATWTDYLDRHVFAPAGMRATSPRAGDGATAIPYTGARALGVKPLPFYVGLPAGGGYATVDDLARFGAALRDGRLLPPDALALLTTPRLDAGESRRSAGLRIGGRGGAAYWGHSGAAPGVNGDYSFYPASGYEVVVLANRGHPAAANVAEFAGLRLPAGAP